MRVPARSPLMGETVGGRDHRRDTSGFLATMTATSSCGIRTPAEGLTVSRDDGANLNQGTESTLAFVSTMQQARHAARVHQ